MMACRSRVSARRPFALVGMAKRPGAMHVAKVSKKYMTRSGPRASVSFLLGRTFRDAGKVKHETLANLSPLPAATIEAARASLAGSALVVAGQGVEVTRCALEHRVGRRLRVAGWGSAGGWVEESVGRRNRSLLVERETPTI